MLQNDNVYKTECLLVERYGILLSIFDLADLLKLQERTVRNKISSGKLGIPINKYDGCTRMHASDVALYLHGLIKISRKRGRPTKSQQIKEKTPGCANNQG